MQAQAQMKALIFDCDGVILESEELHRIAYNAAFEYFDMRVRLDALPLPPPPT